MGDDDKGCFIAFIGIGALIVGMLAAGFNRGRIEANEDFRQEAVELGHATYDVAPDGTTTFRWLEHIEAADAANGGEG